MNTPEQRESLAWKKKPLPELVRLGWPIIVQLLSFSVMTMVDTLFVGRLGAKALAAVGLGGMVIFSVVSLGLGTFAGAKVLVSQLVGAGRREQAGRFLGEFFRIGALMSALIGLLSLAVAAVLPWVSADLATGLLARDYAWTRTAAVPAVLFAAAIGQFRQALGDTQVAMRATLVANAVNIPLNAALIFGLQWGVVGAALASVASRFVEVSILLFTQRREGLFLRVSTWSGAFKTLRFGLPAGVERWLDVGAFAVLVFLIARIGPAHVAAHQVVLQIAHFGFLPMIALSEAVCVLVGQAVGAREPSLVHRVSRLALVAGVGYAIVTAAAYSVFSTTLLSLFTSDTEVLRLGQRVIQAAAVLQVLHAAYNVQKGALRGLGEIRLVALVTVGCAWLFTPPLTYLFGMVLGMGAAGGWWALGVEVGAGTLVLGVRLAAWRYPNGFRV